MIKKFNKNSLVKSIIVYTDLNLAWFMVILLLTCSIRYNTEWQILEITQEVA